MVSKEAANTDHDDVTIALSKKESSESMDGMAALYSKMREKTLIVKAYALDDPSCPALTSTGNAKMRKLVHFVRHGQGFHNLMADLHLSQGKKWVKHTKDPNNPYIAPELTDSPLTNKGREQAYLAKGIAEKLTTKPQLVVLSPLCRALQTGVMVFEPLVGTSTQFLAHEMAREESGVHTCDKRRPTSKQSAEFPQVDFSLLTSEEDPLYSDTHRETRMEVGERIYTFMEWLSKREEEHVAVVSHSGWLLTVFNGILECSDDLKPWFQTGEMRSVVVDFTSGKESSS